MSSLRRVLIITAVWRLCIAGIGILAHFLSLPGTATFSLLKQEGWSSNPLSLALDACARYDAIWYGTIARSGYTFSPHNPFSTINFFPLFPLLVKVVSIPLGNVWIAGILIANVCLFGAVALLHEWLRWRGLQDRAAMTTVLLLVFPGSVFFGFMYTESLYLLLCIATFVFYERNRFVAATACAFLLTLTRPTGLLILVWIGLEAWRRRGSWRLWIPALGAASGLASFLVYQYLTFGTATAQIQAASHWPVTSRTFSQGLADLTLRQTPGHSPAALILLEFTGVTFLAVVPLVYRYFGPAYTAFALASIVVPALTGLASYQRYLSVVFLVPAALEVWRSRRADRVANLTVFAWLWWNLVFMVAAAALYVSEGGAF